METVVRQNLPFNLSIESLKEVLLIDEEFEEEFKETLDECLRIANPKYIYCALDVTQEGDQTFIGGEGFESRILKRNLEGVQQVYAYAVTCGRELYEYALSMNDPLTRYWIDTISERVLYQANASLFGEVRALTGTDNVSSLNPGSLPDFPITGQKPLFRLLGDVYGKIGVELTDTCLMLPYKSLSGFYFASQTEFVNCALCQREECPNRRAPFDEMLYNTTFLL